MSKKKTISHLTMPSIGQIRSTRLEIRSARLAQRTNQHSIQMGLSMSHPLMITKDNASDSAKKSMRNFEEQNQILATVPMSQVLLPVVQ